MSQTIDKCAATLLVVALATSTVIAQRPPQFSFPQPLQGGFDVFSSNQPPQPDFSSQQQPSVLVSSSSPTSSSGSIAVGSSQPSDASLLASSHASQSARESLNTVSRPTLSQSSRPSQSSASNSPPSRQLSQATNVQATSTVSRPSQNKPAGSPHRHTNLQPQQTSQAAAAGSQQNSIEAARKAEATAASLAAASSAGNYKCPDSFGYFRHHKSCDKYWACDNGTATLKLCGNGLMFDDSDPKRENCAYPFSVDCGADRTDLEAPISTPHCPRLYGLFPDTGNCRVFYSCWNGESSKYECPPGLAYDNEQRVCVWADHVDRCDQSEVSDGFVCPDPTEADQPGHYTRHAHPTDCRKFYVCIEGVARPYGCSFGTVFNVDSLQCDEPENVSGCEKYYGDLDPKLSKKLAKENNNAGQTSVQRGSNSAGSSSSSSSVSKSS